jgi:hypothetical protein
MLMRLRIRLQVHILMRSGSYTTVHQANFLKQTNVKIKGGTILSCNSSAPTALCLTAPVAPAPKSPVTTAAASTVLALKAPTSAPTTPFPTALVALAPTDAALTAVFGYGSDSAKMMPPPAPALQPGH